MTSHAKTRGWSSVGWLRGLAALVCVAVFGAAVWLGAAPEPAQPAWIEVLPGILRTPALPAGYAIVDGTNALLIDAPQPLGGLKAKGVQKIERVLLTHHHWDTCAETGTLLTDQVPVQASVAAAEWLTPANVRKHWQDTLPLRNSRANYLVVPVGFEGIDCTLKDQQTIAWRSWTLQVIATPGHSRDHVSFTARKGSDGTLIVFAGDALQASGKLWTPYTTDWNHWTDEGLKPAAESLRKLAALKPSAVLPAHGVPILQEATAALTKTADLVAEVGFLKSFERFTKERLGNAPTYAFLAKEQAASAGKLPWSQISPHLFLTGNTYVLTSKENACLVIDPWGQLSADQIAKLQKERNLGTLEVVMFSHAHFDHYDGIYYLPDRDKLKVWTLDGVAGPIAQPFQQRAPFLDARPVKIDQQFKDGDTTTWREYNLRFRHLPGQTVFTMGVETVIDGKKCFFTADNFFHQDQFSGSGGWMGLNRSFPKMYAASAQKVLDAGPDWVLAEHGGAFEFNAEDFRRRVRWGQACAVAADAISPSGDHETDWNPHRVHVQPLLQKAKAGAVVTGRIETFNRSAQPVMQTITLLGRGLFPDQTLQVTVPARGANAQPFRVQLGTAVPAGRHVAVLRIRENNESENSDAFFVVDVE